MVKKTNRTKTIKQPKETAEQYFLKLVVLLILGAIWLRISINSGTTQIPIPIGLIAGLLLLRNERFQIDKKIEYALLLVTAFISFWLPMGIQITL